MNNSYRRIRNQTLVITEGNHEKNLLLKLILTSFPEIPIIEENILMYETNIYVLYNKIVSEYGTDWSEQDIDLPKCVSHWKSITPELEKRNFTNVILIFDYERHDPNFSETVIQELQEYFSDINDNGQLLINYPMVESYRDIDLCNTCEFENLCVCANILKGSEYKNKVKARETHRIFHVYNKLIDHIDDYLHNKQLSQIITMKILKEIGDRLELQQSFFSKLSGYMNVKDARTLSYQYSALLSSLGFNNSEENYFSYLRSVFFTIIIANIRKASKLQGRDYSMGIEDLKDFYYDNLCYLDILSKQNNDSRNAANGFIWVINTSIFIVANYKFFWREILK
ncbi:hypothetical protein [uncultured Ruminococcus sp.]|uniref:hypothetical protein n=1 Tax=uncultured Ruminococcus sp. TaxID=165186 RepID=UPI00292DDB48|nr:hypothetical protein [uncultured Ruminococcus sp.]